jgi:hypothetical protein
MAEGWFHELWQADRKIQLLNAESNYAEVVALVPPLR